MVADECQGLSANDTAFGPNVQSAAILRRCVVFKRAFFFDGIGLIEGIRTAGIIR